MNLADTDGLFRFLCFDFDSDAGNAAKDATRFSRVLDRCNIRRVVTVSGPSGGRHVWVALAEGVPLGTVSVLADFTKQLFPSLDKSPLKNAATGAVRPPLSPHRTSGFVSMPLGDDDIVEVLTAASTTVSDVELLLDVLVENGAERPKPALGALPHLVDVDVNGRPRIRGVRREPSVTVRRLLDHGGSSNTSLTLHRVLTGLAHARWSFDDVQLFASVSPAFEHVRTRSHGGIRLPRTGVASARMLDRAWQSAVMFVASHPLNSGDDPDFEVRLDRVTEMVQIVQGAADASPGRWRGAGLAHRLVLDAVCLFMLQAVRDDVEVDVRRLAFETGFGRETTRKALIALAGDGWLLKTRHAAGVRGSFFSFGQKFLTSGVSEMWSQVITRPRLSAIRENDIEVLASKLFVYRQDCFTSPGSLGRAAAATLLALPRETFSSVAAVSSLSGLSARSTRFSLRRLSSFGLTNRVGSGWVNYSGVDVFESASISLGVDGFQLARRSLYDADRYCWAWWQAEVQWMRKRGKGKRRRSNSPTAVPLFGSASVIPAFPRYPRNQRRRGDHRLAKQIALQGTSSFSLVA